MDILLHIKADFKCVYMLNGEFLENADAIKYKSGEPIYITVLPLEAQFLPYTVKVLGGRALSNEGLASVYMLKENRYHIKLKARYNYVYSVEGKKRGGQAELLAVPLTHAEKLFFFVKKGQLDSARSVMSDELSRSIDDKSLIGFFDDYSDIVPNPDKKSPDNSFYLIGENGEGVEYNFIMKGKFIDDILSE